MPVLYWRRAIAASLTPTERLWRLTPEKDVQAAIRDAAARFGWAYDHARQSVRKLPDGRVVGDPHSKGRPDTTLARPGELVLVECKRELGQVTPTQEAWLRLYATVPGVRAFVVRPSNLAEVIDVLRAPPVRGRAPGILIPHGR